MKALDARVELDREITEPIELVDDRFEASQRADRSCHLAKATNHVGAHGLAQGVAGTRSETCQDALGFCSPCLQIGVVPFKLNLWCRHCKRMALSKSLA